MLLTVLPPQPSMSSQVRDEIVDTLYCPGFSVDFGYPKSGHQACIASVSPTSPSPRSPLICYWAVELSVVVGIAMNLNVQIFL